MLHGDDSDIGDDSGKKLSSVQFNPLNRSDKQHDLQKLFTINV